MSKNEIIRPINWEGPFSWPGYNERNGLDSIPSVSGVYLQTFQFRHGYLIYAAGITRREIPKRFSEHNRAYFNGDYNVLDVNAIQEGLRKEIWHGWGYARNHRDEFEENKSSIIDAVDKQLEHFRIFIADLGKEPRIHERIEAAVMNNLYKHLPPICDLPDKGMQLSPRLESESEIIIRNNCDSLLFGLPQYMSI